MDSTAKLTLNWAVKKTADSPGSTAAQTLAGGDSAATAFSAVANSNKDNKRRMWRRALLVPAAILWLLASVLLCASPDTWANSSSRILPLESMNADRGTLSDQGLAVLATMEQSGRQDDWSNYLEAAPDRKRFISVFDFRYTPAFADEQLTKLHLSANTLGSSFAYQHRTLQIRNVVSGRWQTLGNNWAAESWVWQRHDYTVNENPRDFVDSTGKIKIRYRSSNSYDVSNIDFLQLTAEYESSNSDPPVSTDERKPPPVDSDEWWQPGPEDGLTWQWQINGELDTSLAVDMYDIDLFDTSAEQIQALQDAGKIVVCYFSAGTYEGWRPDWQRHFPFITGDQYTGDEPPFAANMADWDERWLDIRYLDLLAPIMRERLQLAVAKGCDAVEPDNVDSYSNASEVQRPVSYADQLAYNRWLAAEAHSLGLSIGLKNDVGQLVDLVDHFDWAINEQCFQYQECSAYSVFTTQGKAVFGVEYSGAPEEFCPAANSLQMSWLKKRLSLNSWRIGCENY